MIMGNVLEPDFAGARDAIHRHRVEYCVSDGSTLQVAPPCVNTNDLSEADTP